MARGKKLLRCVATHASMPLRYTNNVYHQAEIVYPMVNYGLSGSPVKVVVHWRFALLPWSRAMLTLLLPAASLLVGNATVPSSCRLFGQARLPGSYFADEREAAAVRAASLAACQLRPRVAKQGPDATLLYMPRAGHGLQSGTKRNFEAADALVTALRSAMPRAAHNRTASTPGGETPICEQLALWRSADVLLTPNGAHFVNAPFMAAGAVLVEGVPWCASRLRLLLPIPCAHGTHSRARPPGAATVLVAPILHDLRLLRAFQHASLGRGLTSAAAQRRRAPLVSPPPAPLSAPTPRSRLAGRCVDTRGSWRSRDTPPSST